VGFQRDEDEDGREEGEVLGGLKSPRWARYACMSASFMVREGGREGGWVVVVVMDWDEARRLFMS